MEQNFTSTQIEALQFTIFSILNDSWYEQNQNL
jgi:hypothetical protein